MIALASLFVGDASAATAAWGADYFPNVPLTTHEGRTVRFFDDLLEGRIVAVNFIYTRCVDTCPLETAQLVRVQEILGERLGRDVFFYSISIDPANDTPQTLAAYRNKFGARWTFLTGKEADITTIRRKLGLYIEEIQDGSKNHNVNMIIGNQATGRWMKRSPFENPHVLADQLGNWLDGWRSKPVIRDYASAPELRRISRGEQVFRTRCATCHTLTGHEAEGALGPDLIGVTKRRERRWLLEWLRSPDRMLARKDPIAMALFERYDRLPMPNMRLNRSEALALLDYIATETKRRERAFDPAARAGLLRTATDTAAPVARGDVVAVADAWVRVSQVDMPDNAGYMKLVNLGEQAVTLTAVESDAFERVEMHEMAVIDGLRKMRARDDAAIPAGGVLRFEPGGRHLMLIGRRQLLVAGQTIDVTLTFASGRSQRVSLEIAAR